MLCSPTYPSGCEIDGIVVNSTMLDGYAVATSDYYRFMLINCIGYQVCRECCYRISLSRLTISSRDLVVSFS